MHPDNTGLTRAGNAEAILFCTVTLPVSAAASPADYERIAANLRGRFAAVDVWMPRDTGGGWLGSDDPLDGVIAETAIARSGAVIDSLIVSLIPPGPDGGTTMMTVRVVSLLFPPES